MVSHGLVAGGLFTMVGMIYERCHTREIAAYGGLAKLLPVYSVFFMILTLASIGLPTTSGFTGEFMALMGAFNAAWPRHLAGDSLPLVLAVVAVTGVVLGAMYMLWLAQRMLFGESRAPHQPLVDLGARERVILVAFVVAIFALGLFPQDRSRRPSPPRSSTSSACSAPAAGGRAMNWPLILTSMLPEHLLLVGMLAILGLEIRSGRPRDGFVPALLFVAAAAAAALWLYATDFAGQPFPDHLSVRPASSLPKFVLLGLALPVLLISRDDFAETPYYTLVLASLYGACLIVSSDSFPTLFLGIEIMSLRCTRSSCSGCCARRARKRRSSTSCSAAPPPRCCCSASPSFTAGAARCRSPRSRGRSVPPTRSPSPAWRS